MSVRRTPPDRRDVRTFSSASFEDETTGKTVWRVTDGNAIDHSLYFVQPSWTADCETLLYVSDRSGSFQLHGASIADGTTAQLTDVPDFDGLSAVPSGTENVVYFSAGRSVWRLDVDSAEVTRLARLDASPAGCDLNRSEEYVVTTTEGENGSHVWWVATDGSGAERVVSTAHSAFHAQCSPYDDDLILYSNGLAQRMWLVRSDGSNHRPLYEHDATTWLTHETWLGDTGEILFVHWPEALCAIDVETEATRTVETSGNVWHPSVGPGDRIVADTTHPDDGIVAIDPTTGERRPVCRSGSSNAGTQWGESTPAMDEHAKGIVDTDTYGPQWTHPHPAYDWAGDWVTFTSDRSGTPDVYLVQPDA